MRTFNPYGDGDNALATPVPVRPTFGSTVNAQPILLSWRSVPGANHYDIEVSNNLTFQERDTLTVPVKATATDTTVLIQDLQMDRWYYWRIRAVGDGTMSKWSSDDYSIGIFRASSLTTDVVDVSVRVSERYMEVSTDASSDMLTIRVRPSTAGVVMLYTSNGKEMGNFRHQIVRSAGEEIVFPTASLSSGMYYVVYAGEDGTVQQVVPVTVIH